MGVVLDLGRVLLDGQEGRFGFVGDFGDVLGLVLDGVVFVVMALLRHVDGHLMGFVLNGAVFLLDRDLDFHDFLFVLVVGGLGVFVLVTCFSLDDLGLFFEGFHEDGRNHVLLLDHLLGK